MKRRNSVLTVNLETMANNVKILQRYLEQGVKLMAVIKAHAYGHGAIEVARHLTSIIDWFAVNDIEEGIELRSHNIEDPVLVFGVPEADTAGLYGKYNLTATVSASAHFQLLPEGTQYHLNFDTGMGRLGFLPEAVGEVRELKENHTELQCTGIYSHFATADAVDSPKSKEQYQIFKEIRGYFAPEVLAHLCNTAGIVQRAEAQFDMVRSGIGIYGYPPGQISVPELEPVMQWETKIVQVKSIKKGETVSYGAVWKAEKDGFIGVIPVGYSDGIPRGLSGNFSVTIDGERYPVAGAVTMNYCMVDLGNRQFEPGTKVQLWNAHHTAGDWAKTMNTIPYEIVTNIPPDIPRKYIGK